jgi:hypothetical protein
LAKGEAYFWPFSFREKPKKPQFQKPKKIAARKRQYPNQTGPEVTMVTNFFEIWLNKATFRRKLNLDSPRVAKDQKHNFFTREKTSI